MLRRGDGNPREIQQYIRKWEPRLAEMEEELKQKQKESDTTGIIALQQQINNIKENLEEAKLESAKYAKRFEAEDFIRILGKQKQRKMRELKQMQVEFELLDLSYLDKVVFFLKNNYKGTKIKITHLQFGC